MSATDLFYHVVTIIICIHFLLFMPDTLNASIMSLFSGMCDEAYGQEFGYFHYEDVYQFEMSSSPIWTAWNANSPVITTEDSFCGRHSLFVSHFILFLFVSA